MILKKVIIHCSATKNGGSTTIDDIRRWHLERNFSDVGYHLVILPDGTVQRGRGLNKQGAHCEGQNEGSAGICLIGTDKFTKAQFSSLDYQIKSILMCYPTVKPWAIYGHYEFKSAQKQGKTCPNLDMNAVRYWLVTGIDEGLKVYYL